MVMTHREARVWTADVVGGSVEVLEWPLDQATAEPPVVAIHGITANRTAWELFARHLPGRRVLATDLRGRGRSADLPGPYGMAAHAADLLAVLDAAEVTQAVVVGHSMGASVGVVLRHLEPGRVAALLLVDGGLPVALPPGMTPELAAEHVLGPALQRLSMTFPDAATYRDFWRRHPAFQGEWSDAVQRYVEHDLVGTPGALHSCVQRVAVEADFVDQLSGGDVRAAWAGLRGVPFGFLRAPRGLMNETPGLYPPEVMAAFSQSYPSMRWLDVEDVNHYSILLTDRGASAVATAVTDLVPDG